MRVSISFGSFIHRLNLLNYWLSLLMIFSSCIYLFSRVQRKQRQKFFFFFIEFEKIEKKKPLTKTANYFTHYGCGKLFFRKLLSNANANFMFPTFGGRFFLFAFLFCAPFSPLCQIAPVSLTLPTFVCHISAFYQAFFVFAITMFNYKVVTFDLCACVVCDMLHNIAFRMRHKIMAEPNTHTHISMNTPVGVCMQTAHNKMSSVQQFAFDIAHLFFFLLLLFRIN